MIDYKVYNSWAFTDKQDQKARINQQIYDDLRGRYKIFRHDTEFYPQVDLDQYDIVIGRQPEFLSARYNIIKNDPNLSTEELLLICDHGNLCFGGKREKRQVLRVFED